MLNVLKYVTGFFVGVAVCAVFSMNRVSYSYERGKASVFMECAAGHSSTFYKYRMSCETSTKTIQTQERIYAPRTHATI